ncbi:MAG: GTPase [Phycisphaerae bacterium]
MQRFIRALAQRYRVLRNAGATALPDATATDERLTELLLAEAALRYARPARGHQEGRPLQLAVLGPTQTGKSTIVNLILGCHLAEVSPLAGFTTHPQGFWIGASKADESWASELFPGWQRCEASQLSRDELERYALTPEGGTPVLPIPPTGLPPCVIWDTPDFDTLAAHTYRRGVLEVAALADAHVFVLSKEKYCDLSVWRMLRLLSPLGRPLLICLNKLTPEAIQPVIASLKQRLTDMGGGAAAAPIVPFEYQAGFDATADLSALPEVWELRDRIARRLKAVHATSRSAGLKALVRQHWSDWIAPLEVEMAAVRAWHERVAAALRQAAESYRRDFLDHPQRFDTFRRATVELLHLLELPGFAGVLSQVRHVLSWPARRLFAARQAWFARRRKLSGMPHGLGSEEVVLFQLIEKLLTSLERDAARRSDPTTPGHAVWRALAQRLEQQEARLRATFQAAAQKQREDFAPVIHATANRLYESLQEKPALLNTLRAARATTDVASIALAIKVGGLGLNDLLFAPAIFALTSMLTEGALGSYMTHIAHELKKRQFEHVNAKLIEDVFAKELHNLAVGLKDAGLFGISPEQLRAAAQALEAWEQSDDE